MQNILAAIDEALDKYKQLAVKYEINMSNVLTVFEKFLQEVDPMVLSEEEIKTIKSIFNNLPYLLVNSTANEELKLDEDLIKRYGKLITTVHELVITELSKNFDHFNEVLKEQSIRISGIDDKLNKDGAN